MFLKNLKESCGSIAFNIITSSINNENTEILIDTTIDRCSCSIFYNYNISCFHIVNCRIKKNFYPLITEIPSYYFIKKSIPIENNDVVVVDVPSEKTESWGYNDCLSHFEPYFTLAIRSGKIRDNLRDSTKSLDDLKCSIGLDSL